jgi:hypothetical protein
VPLAPDLLAAISDDGPPDKKRSKINYLKETVMLNWHSDLCAGEETSRASQTIV